MSKNIVEKGYFVARRYCGPNGARMYQISDGNYTITIDQEVFLEMCIKGLQDFVEEKR